MTNNENGLKYRLFTIKNLTDWLFHNSQNGISRKIIAVPRAYAFVVNPHAKEDDVVLSVVYNDADEPIGYTAVFGERFVRPVLHERYFWGSTQWLEPEYRGKGASWKMMKDIKEAVDNRYIALDSTIASCRLDQKQGSRIIYYPRYFMRFRTDAKTLKAKIKQKWVECKNKKILSQVRSEEYTNQYVNFIDDESYRFISEHSSTNFFLRTQEMLNWQLHNQLYVQTKGDKHVDNELCEFGGYVDKISVEIIKVYVKEQLVGIYVLHTIDDTCTLLYLYLDECYKKNVYASIAASILDQNLRRFRTFNKCLFDFLCNIGITHLNKSQLYEEVSFTIPADFEVDASLQLQGGDGDMFA